MKKIISLAILVFIILTIVPFSFADVDLKSMTIEELNELISQAQNEILLKGGDTIVSAGDYTAGVDIASGTYEFKMVNDDLLKTYTVMKDGKLADSKYLSPNEFTRIRLEDGQTLHIYTSCYLRKASLIGF